MKNGEEKKSPKLFRTTPIVALKRKAKRENRPGLPKENRGVKSE